MTKRQRAKLDKAVAKFFIYDGCHKIFLIKNKKDEAYAIEREWDRSDFRPFDRDKIEELYDASCPLRAVWWMTATKRKTVIEQFDKDNKY